MGNILSTLWAPTTNQPYLNIVADHSHFSMAPVYHPLMVASSTIMHNVTKQKSSQKSGLLKGTMENVVLMTASHFQCL